MYVEFNDETSGTYYPNEDAEPEQFDLEPERELNFGS
jgi:hypothetical protein